MESLATSNSFFFISHVLCTRSEPSTPCTDATFFRITSAVSDSLTVDMAVGGESS
jgi:hypothetical protein